MKTGRHFKNKTTLVYAVILLVFLCLNSPSPVRAKSNFTPNGSESLQTIQNVFYLVANPRKDSINTIWGLEVTGQVWKPINIQSLDPHFKNNVWLKLRLPKMSWKDPELFLEMPVRNFEVYQNRCLIYRSRDGFHERKWNRSSLRIHFIHLIPVLTQQTVYIHIFADRFSYAKVWGKIQIGDQAVYSRQIVRSDLIDMVLTFIFVFIGIFLLTLYPLNRKGYLPFTGIGLVALSIGIFKIPEINSSQLIWDQPTIKYYSEAFCFYFLPVGMILFVGTFTNFAFGFRQIKLIYRLLILGFTIHAILMIALDIANILPVYTTYNLYSISLITVLIFLMISGFRIARKANFNVRLILISGILAVLTGIHDIIGVITGFFLLGHYINNWGVLVFIITLILFMMKRFMLINGDLLDLNKTLEKRVANRTAELEKANMELDEVNRQLNTTLQNLQETHIQLIQSEKMALLGGLVNGITHEIDTPLELIKSNVKTKKAMLSELATEKSENFPEFIQKASALNHENKTALSQIIDLVKGLKNFARLDEAETKIADLHQGLNSTLLIINSQLKGQIEIIKAYGHIPALLCFPQQLNQVFLHLLSNLLQAMNGRGRLTIRTEYRDNKIIIGFEITGAEVSAGNLSEIIKPVEVNNGLGQQLCNEIIERHHGRITINNEPGKGADLIVELPAN